VYLCVTLSPHPTAPVVIYSIESCDQLLVFSSLLSCTHLYCLFLTFHLVPPLTFLLFSFPFLASLLMLSCRDSSDGEGGDDSGTDDDADEDEEEKKKWVPEWAKGPLLKEALERVSDSPSSFSPYLSPVLTLPLFHSFSCSLPHSLSPSLSPFLSFSHPLPLFLSSVSFYPLYIPAFPSLSSSSNHVLLLFLFPHYFSSIFPFSYQIPSHIILSHPFFSPVHQSIPPFHSPTPFHPPSLSAIRSERPHSYGP
jgi:Inner centromere protein, ARK binding region